MSRVKFGQITYVRLRSVSYVLIRGEKMKKIILIATVIVSLLCPLLTFAEETRTIQLDTIVVTPSRIAQHGYKVASNVSVIDSKQIDTSNAKTVIEILQQELGVHTYDNSTPKTAVIDIRGFGDTASRNILVLVNDRKINTVDITGPDTLQIPLEAVERIEIIRGAGSVLYGDNAVGGVINIITKEGKGDLSGKVGQLYGSYRTRGTDLEVSGSKKFEWSGLDNEISYYFFSKYYDTGGYRSNSDLVSKDYNTRLGYKLSDKVSVNLSGGWHEDDYGLPGGLSFAELATLGRKGSADPEDFASSKDRFVQLGLDVKPWPEDIDLGHFVLDFSYRNRDTYSSFAAFFNTKREIDSFGLNGKYVFDQTLFGKEFNVVAGFDFYDTDNHILGSEFNTDDLTISKRESGFYLFSEYEAFENVFINLGSRLHEANYVFDQKAAVASYTSDTPRESVNVLGMKYEYAKGSNIFFDAQQTFRFLATDEWYDSFTGTLNTDLKQQTGIQYEAGIKHNFRDTTLFSVTPYWMDLKNEIFLNPTAGFFGSNDNYDKTRRVGVEAGQKTDLLRLFPADFIKQFEVFTNYSYQDPRFLKGTNDDKLIPMAPQHQASFGFNIGFPSHLSASLGGHYVGSTFAINDTLNVTPMVKPYFTLDGKLSYEAKNFEFFAALNNMLDEKYFTYVVKSVSSTSKDHFPAPGRNFSVGINLKF